MTARRGRSRAAARVMGLAALKEEASGVVAHEGFYRRLGTRVFLRDSQDGRHVFLSVLARLQRGCAASWRGKQNSAAAGPVGQCARLATLGRRGRDIRLGPSARFD